MADEKITDMTENTTPAGADLMELVDDPTGTPDNQKITLDNLFGYLNFAVDAADNLGLRNGTTAQEFRVYNTFTDASNNEFFKIEWVSNLCSLLTQKNGTGINRTLRIGTSGNASIQFMTNNTARWIVDTTGHLTVVSDNAKDIGSNGASRPRDVYVAGAVHTQDAGELTIATGAVTATGGFHTIDTESDAASDDLDTINGGIDGHILVIQAENTARTVVAKDGTGNLQLAGDFSMDNTQDTLTLLFSGALSAWVELSRSDNGA